MGNICATLCNSLCPMPIITYIPHLICDRASKGHRGWKNSVSSKRCGSISPGWNDAPKSRLHWICNLKFARSTFFFLLLSSDPLTVRHSKVCRTGGMSTPRWHSIPSGFDAMGQGYLKLWASKATQPSHTCFGESVQCAVTGGASLKDFTLAFHTLQSTKILDLLGPPPTSPGHQASHL